MNGVWCGGGEGGGERRGEGKEEEGGEEGEEEHNGNPMVTLSGKKNFEDISQTL